jgi:asparagine synthase (glutamine-hydrolysing)
VVLQAYSAFGTACIERFRGMFAFALWDAQRHELFLCRDRLGLKPLYYAELPGALLFASELRALLATGLVERRLDPAALETFLANGFVVSPRTMVAGARSLLPGCWMRVRPDGRITQTSRYWKLAAPAGPRDPEELVTEARERLRAQEGVGDRLR